MRVLLAMSLFILIGCVGNKPVAEKSVAENKAPVALKAKQCDIIRNAPDFIQDALKDSLPQLNIDTQETCKPLETIICDGVEYRLYEICLPSRRIIYNLLIEKDFL